MKVQPPERRVWRKTCAFLDLGDVESLFEYYHLEASTNQEAIFRYIQNLLSFQRPKFACEIQQARVRVKIHQIQDVEAVKNEPRKLPSFHSHDETA